MCRLSVSKQLRPGRLIFGCFYLDGSKKNMKRLFKGEKSLGHHPLHPQFLCNEQESLLTIGLSLMNQHCQHPHCFFCEHFPLFPIPFGKSWLGQQWGTESMHSWRGVFDWPEPNPLPQQMSQWYHIIINGIPQEGWVHGQGSKETTISSCPLPKEFILPIVAWEVLNVYCH